jgi:SWIM zinc finger
MFGRGDMRPVTQEKARRLARTGAVHRFPVADVYNVAGDHGTYLVVVAPGIQFCSCPAERFCSHLAAVALVALDKEAG